MSPGRVMSLVGGGDERLAMWLAVVIFMDIFLTGLNHAGAWWLDYWFTFMQFAAGYTVLYVMFFANRLPGYYIFESIPPMTAIIIPVVFCRWFLLAYAGADPLHEALDVLVSVWWVDLVLATDDVVAWLLSPIRWAVDVYLAAGGVLR